MVVTAGEEKEYDGSEKINDSRRREPPEESLPKPTPFASLLRHHRRESSGKTHICCPLAQSLQVVGCDAAAGGRDRILHTGQHRSDYALKPLQVL